MRFIVGVPIYHELLPSLLPSFLREQERLQPTRRVGAPCISPRGNAIWEGAMVPIANIVKSHSKRIGTYARLGSGATVSVNPDVLGHDHALLIKREVLLESLRP